MSKKTITIADILNRIRNIKYVMMHKDGGTKYLSLNELTDDDKKLEINWFEVTMFQGQKCIEFNLKSLNNKLRVWWIPQVGSSNSFYIPVKSVEEGKKVMDLLAAYDMFQLQNNIKPDFCNVGGLQMFVDGEWEDWYLETEDDYFDDVDEYCKKCERSEEIDNFSKDLFEQIDFKTLYAR